MAGLSSSDNYSSKEVDSVLKSLATSRNGLHDHEASSRLKKYGVNSVSEKHVNQFVKFLSYFASPLIMILIFAAGISLAVGQKTDAVIIFLMVIFGVLLDYFQEYSADKSVKKLLESVKATATVIRSGKKKTIHTKEIAIGDILFLSPGDMVPADARIIEAKDFFVSQATITGESFPSEKTSEPVPSKSDSIADQTNIVFSGTSVVSGSATAVVIKTGEHTEFGKISSSLSQKQDKSEFEVGVSKFSLLVMKVTFFLVIFIFLFNSIFKHDYLQSFMFAIAIAVGLTPELLPVIMSVTMAVGSKKMAKKGVIVKKLSAIPNFGGMNILCTDKTGTLTENKIELVKYTSIDGKEDEHVFFFTYLNSFFQTGIKNSMDEAVLNFRETSTKQFDKVDEIPYDFTRKRMSVVVRKSRKDVLITKGAPEEIFNICKYYRLNGKQKKLSKEAKNKAIKLYHALSNDGYRVLAVATKDIVAKKTYSKHDESEMVLIGFVSFLDPPKKDVKQTIKDLEELGVEIKVITGDNELVTKKVCSEVGLEVKGILLGSEISQMQDNALRIKAANTTIFARCSPTEKNRIIHVLKSGDNVVGYLGDGINDAPSLKSADVGISVDTAVDVAKESAELVLTKKSLHDLKEGIIEGRKTFGNTVKYVMMTLSSNFGNMFSAAGAVLFLPFLPMLPIQILLNNLIYDFSQITIPTDNVDEEWTKKPKRWNLPLLKKFMYVFGAISSIFDFITFFVLYFVIKSAAPVFQTAWFMESLATQILVIYVIRTKQTPFIKSRPSMLVVLSSIGCLALGWILPYTAIGRYFKFMPIPFHILLILAGIVLVYLVVVQLTKKWFYAKYDFDAD